MCVILATYLPTYSSETGGGLVQLRLVYCIHHLHRQTQDKSVRGERGR